MKTHRQETTGTVTMPLIMKEFRALEKRFDARLDVHHESMKAYIDSRISQVNHRLAGVEDRLGHRITMVDKRLDSLEKRVDTIDRRVETLDKKVDTLDKKVDTLDKKVDTLDKNVKALDQKLDIRVEGLVQLIETRVGENLGLGVRVNDHERRLVVLESARKN